MDKGERGAPAPHGAYGLIMTVINVFTRHEPEAR